MVEVSISHPLDGYLRRGALPHIWCAGCGYGVILNCFIRALRELEFNLNNLVVVSGIGCIGRISGYINADGFHTTHGRALAFATGVKLVRPHLKVVVISGDGDLFAIGGNHFIHAARRNIDVTVICANNFVYGMTGGQLGPTTPLSAYTPTTPYGSVEHPFNLVYLAAGSGAVYVARWTIFHVRELITSMKKALMRKGLSFVEIITPCPTLFGRYNRLGTAVDILEWLKTSSVTRYHSNPAEAEITLGGKIIVGEFIDTEKVTYSELVREMTKKIQQRLEKEGKLTLASL
ncbi:2-oxoacid:ferredoxin oxidoreductase subunit beta [Candidatus Bathyarchaeota archaeon]|nr:2-oxoacid:ferredoxin oxidoreductase subunit beta [Candidatus Bathyarchaeota archaeon]